MSFKLDIFDLLGRLNDPKQGDIYTALTDEEKKGFAPLVVMRWASGTSDTRQIMLLNEFVNPNVFTLGKHPHLLMMLMQAANSKTNKRYSWLGVKSKKKNSEALRVIQEFYDMSEREVKLMNPRPSESEILSMAEQLGWDKDEIAKLKKEAT